MLIGLTGYARHGKDSVGKILIEKYGFGGPFSFASTLKSMALALNPIVGRSRDLEAWIFNRSGRIAHFPRAVVRLKELIDCIGPDEAKEWPEVRAFYQKLGTEGVRDHLGQEAWVDALGLKLYSVGALGFDPLNDRYDCYLGTVKGVITDVRFPNEADAIKRWGGQVWRVVRLNPDGTDYDNGIGKDHPSEAHIASLPVDMNLIASDLDGLAQVVDEAMKEDAGGIVTKPTLAVIGEGGPEAVIPLEGP